MDSNSLLKQELNDKTAKESSSVEVEETEFIGANETNLPRDRIDKYDAIEHLCIIPIFRNFQISISKPLIPLRIALFLWYGAASSPVAYLSVFMKQKGLSLVEFSSTFSVTFVFQFLTAFVSGIVADKIGNAKPVLIFHILMTILLILTLLLIPGIDFTANNTTSSYNERNATAITGQDEDTNKTYENILMSAVDFNETDNSNYTHFINYSHQDMVEFVCRGEKENLTAVEDENFSNNCKSRKKIIVILHMIATLIYISSWSAVYRFMDVTVMSLVQKYNSSFGFERFFSISGNVIVTFITAVVFTFFTSEGEQNNYRSIYWFSLSTSCLVLIAVCRIKSQIKHPGRNMLKKGFSLLRNVHIVVFILVIFLLGSFSCFFDSFILWFLEHLNASTLIMGLVQTMYGLYGIPLFLISKYWLRIFGTEMLFIGAYIGYIIYGLGYSFLYDPSWCLLIESAGALTYHMLWVAVIVHCHRIVPEELVSTSIATAGAIHFGIGRSAGVFAGGLLMNSFGPRITFRIFAGASSAAVVLYATYLYCRSPKQKRNAS